MENHVSAHEMMNILIYVEKQLTDRYIVSHYGVLPMVYISYNTFFLTCTEQASYVCIIKIKYNTNL